MGRVAAQTFEGTEDAAGGVRQQAAALTAGVWIVRGHGSAAALRATLRALDLEPFAPDLEGARHLVADWNPGRDEDAHRLGEIYEGALAKARRSVRRRTGVHYTPRALCDSVTRSTLRGLGRRLVEDTGALHVLDLAAGTGAFLLAARRAILAARRLDAEGALDAEAATAFTQEHLHGIDVDPYAILVARLALSIGTNVAPARLRGLVVGDAILGATTEAPFQELLARAGGGFDVVLSNPPYVGGKRIRTHFGEAYTARLAARPEPLSRNADLAAHFLRRAYDVLRPGGVLGFVTTNTIAQGATREAGLGHLIRSGAHVFEARTRVPWPGDAAVVATTVHLARPGGTTTEVPACVLDERAVEAISSLLTSTSTHQQPARIAGRRKLAFIGCFVRGMGFTFDDDNPAATPLAEMRRILAARPESDEVVRPYLGGAEVSQDPAQRHHRYVISFGDASLDEARRRWPELVDIVERRVRPYREGLRETNADRQHARTWWRFANDRAELRRAAAELDHVIVVPRVSPHVMAARVPTGPIFSDQLVVIASASFAMLGLLQSQLHALWAWRLSSTLGDGLRYTPRTVFETLFIPPELGALEGIAEELDRARQRYLEAHAIGLTELYNRIHEQRRDDRDIGALRDLHVALDRAVVDAYGLPQPRRLGFFPSVVEPKKRARFGFSGDDARQLLDHLFALNARAAQEGEADRDAASSRSRAQRNPSPRTEKVAVGAGARTSQ